MMEAKEAIMRIKDFGLYHAIEDLPKSALTVEAFNKAIELLRLELEEKVAERDEDLMNKYFEEGTLNVQEIKK